MFARTVAAASPSRGVDVSRRAGRPTPSRRRLAVAAGPLLVLAHLGLVAGWPVDRVRRTVDAAANVLLAAATLGIADDRAPTAAVGRTVEAVARAAPWPLAGRLTCLRVALVAHALYAQLGVDAEVRVGVLRESGEFEAHAWVVCDGRVVAGAVENLDAYAVLESDEGIAAVR